MKNYRVLMVLVGLLMLLASDFVIAQGRRGRNRNAPRLGGNYQFVDANNDGICDNFVDANNDGICDNCLGYRYGKGFGKGAGYKMRNFVDKDGDGICDYYQSGIFIGVPYPNPFTSTTKFNITLQKEQNVTVALYDSNGKMVKMLNDGNLRAGTHSFTINADNLNKGRYFIVAKSGNQVRSRPIIFNP